MEYPSWDLPMLGGGVLIGTVAILHVFVSHFAVGAGLFLVLNERRAYRENDDGLLAYVRSHSRFFVLVALVFGAVSGVGIWWTIGLVHPSATSTLLHVFVWCWGIEWVLFAVEVTAAFIYYYGWDRLDRRTHLAIGWIYFVAAWLSLFVINGILTFMLTPGDWIKTHALVDAFFNPTMLPSLVVRTAATISLAGLYALLTATQIPEENAVVVALHAAGTGRPPAESLRRRMTRHAAGWVLVGCLIMPFGGVWYVTRIPVLAREISMGGAPAVTIFAGLSVMISGMIVALTWLGPYRNPKMFNPILAAVIAVLALGATAVTEWVREAVRKPYVIYGYMYSNGVRTGEEDAIRKTGVLRAAKWAGREKAEGPDDLAAGYALFRVQCRGCHTVDGYNGLRPMVKGWREDFLSYQLQHLDELKGFMPPFVGNEGERAALARWLHLIGKGKPFEPIPGAEAGRAPDSRPSDRIPRPDPLGLPAPPWLLKVFLIVTFIFHLIPMNLVLAGGGIAAWALGRSRRLAPELAGPYAALGAGLAHLLPTATAFTITLGIAPLLFLQVLYGQAFYTSSVLMAWGWLAVVGLLLAGYYGYYGLAFAAPGAGRGGVTPPLRHVPPTRAAVIGLASSVVFLVIGFLFTTNLTLMLKPHTWGTMYAASEHGLHANWGDPTLWPRYFHFVIASFALTGLAVAFCGRSRERRGEPHGEWIRGFGTRLFIGATAVQFGSGLWFLLSLPEETARLFLGRSAPDTALLWGSVALAVAALFAVRRSLLVGAAMITVTVAGMAVVRHRVREVALDAVLVPESAGVRTQEGAIVLFLIVLVIGVGVTGWMLMRFLKSKTPGTA